MKATIESETDRTIHLTVTDSAGVDHRVAVDRTGAIESHHVGAYPDDPAARSPAVAETIAQVARFAKYVVFRKRGVDALSPYESADRIAYPERLAATALVVGAMAPETLASFFESAYRQRTAGSPSVEAPVDAPEATCVRIDLDLALRLADERLRALLDALIELEAIGGLRQALDRRPDHDDRVPFERLAAALGTELEVGDGADRHRAFLEEPSPIRVHWRVDDATRVTYESRADGGPGGGEYGTARSVSERASERVGEGSEPPLAARIQLPVGTPVHAPAAFQRELVDHLRCQVRDCYVGMGLAPPRDLRVRGPGIAWFAERYERTDVYQRYHDPDAILDWERLAPVPKL